MKTRRIFYVIAIAVFIVLGLSSRKVDFLPAETGDGLWAMMVMYLIRLVFIRQRLKYIALAALAISFLVEFSQIIQWEWLVAFRSTFIGHMMLGQGFVWWDLPAYAIGIFVAYIIARLAEKP